MKDANFGQRFEGWHAVRMVLDRISSETNNGATPQEEALERLLSLTTDEIRDRSFSPDEIDALLDAVMEHFDVQGLVADKAINFLTNSAKRCKSEGDAPCSV
jgi:hypothetical protein